MTHPTQRHRTARRPGGLSPRTRAMWARLYSGPDAGRLPWAFQKPFPPLTRAVEQGWLPSPGPILDVGCGTGTNAIWLARQGYRVTGSDVAPGAISAAEAHRGIGRTNPKFVVDDILASALPASRFRGAVDIGCFHTLASRERRAYSASLARLLTPGAACLLFWVGREETGSWGPPHRLSVTEVTEVFEPSFLVERIEYRPRTVHLSARVRRSARPLATLAGYSLRLLRRSAPQPAAR